MEEVEVIAVGDEQGAACGVGKHQEEHRFISFFLYSPDFELIDAQGDVVVLGQLDVHQAIADYEADGVFDLLASHGVGGTVVLLCLGGEGDGEQDDDG